MNDNGSSGNPVSAPDEDPIVQELRQKVELIRSRLRHLEDYDPEKLQALLDEVQSIRQLIA